MGHLQMALATASHRRLAVRIWLGAGHPPLEHVGVGLWVCAVVLEHHRREQGMRELKVAQRSFGDPHPQPRELPNEVVWVAYDQRYAALLSQPDEVARISSA